jgi:hypothetical protein
MRSRQYVVALAGMLTCFTALAGTVLTENFDNVSSLAGSGWVQTNNSTTPRTTGWFQGTPAVTFPAAAGAPDSYIAANLNNAAFAGAISNWLMTPVLTFGNGTSLNFALRLFGEGFLDTVQVYYSTSGNSSNVGSTTSSTGDFTLLQTFSASDDTGWLAESVLVSGLSGSASGRLAFRYVVDDTSINGDFIGIDSVAVTTVANVPEPESLALVATGLAALGWASRRRAKR